MATALPSPRTGHPLYAPVGSSISYVPILIQRDPDLWGPDANEFKPERWLDNRQPAPHANAFMVFNLGPRTVCKVSLTKGQSANFTMTVLGPAASMLPCSIRIRKASAKC
jgi:Cytochrome P450